MKPSALVLWPLLLSITEPEKVNMSKIRFP
jgi:hypothetical protein